MHISIKDRLIYNFAQDYNEKEEWINFINTLNKNYDVPQEYVKNLLESIKDEPDELTDAFKDGVLNIIENAKQPVPEEVQEKTKKKIQKAPPKPQTITVPKVNPPKVKAPSTPHTHAQDDTLPELQGLLQQGYDTVTWVLNETHDIIDICDELNGKVWSLDQFLAETTHDAPIFSHGHPGDHCYLLVSSQTNPELSTVTVGPTGQRWASISVKDRLKKMSKKDIKQLAKQMITPMK